jgi:guanine deaminase
MAFRNPEGVTTSLSELADRVFSLVIMGDDRAIRATYIMDELVYGDGAIGLLLLKRSPTSPL